MEEMRLKLGQYEVQQKQFQEELQRQKEIAKIERLAGKSHHLLGTKAVPGVMAPIKKSAKLNYPSKKNIPHHLPAVSSPSQIHSIESIPEGVASLETKKHKTNHSIIPFLKLPEEKLRENKELNEWIRSTVGKNPRGIKVKPPIEIRKSSKKENISDQLKHENSSQNIKLAQGPFLVFKLHSHI